MLALLITAWLLMPAMASMGVALFVFAIVAAAPKNYAPSRGVTRRNLYRTKRGRLSFTASDIATW